MFNRNKLANFFWFCAVAFAFALAFGISVEAATIYIWRDDSGVKQYSDTCPPGETCVAKNFGGSKTTSGGGGGKGGKGKSWQNADTSGTSTSDSGTSTTTTDTTTTGTTTTDTTTTGTTTTETTSTDPTTTTSTDPTSTDPTSTDTGTTVPDGATLAWDAVGDSRVMGYRLFYAMAGNEYQAIDVGNSTTYTMTGLESGKRYYFTVAAYDSSGNQGYFSTEVYKDMP